MTKEEKAIYMKVWHIKNKEKERIRKQKWYQENKEIAVRKRKEWKNNNKDKYREYSRRYNIKKYKECSLYRLKVVMYSRMNDFISGKKSGIKSHKTLSYLGCSVKEWKIYLEKQFKDGMNWDNHKRNGWHIDHIIPLDSFDFSNEEDIYKAFHYTNTQPLWYLDNIKKSNKL